MKNILIALLLVFPRLGKAQIDVPPRVYDLLGRLYTAILNPLIALLFAIAFMLFIYGGVRFVWQGENEEERSKGRSSMFWGIIGMVVMMSVFGILQIITETIGVDETIFDNV